MNNGYENPDGNNESEPSFEDLESAFVPLPQMTVEEFVELAKRHLDDMLVHHKEQTGVESQSEHDWMNDLQASLDNE